MLAAVAHSLRAAFEIDAIDERARTGWSVIVTGVAEMVMSATEIERLQRAEPVHWVQGAGTHWVLLHAERVSGRRITAACERGSCSS